MSRNSVSVNLSSAPWQTTLIPSNADSTETAGLVMPPPDTRFILAQLTVPTSDHARMIAYRRFVDAPTSLSPATATAAHFQQTVTLYEIHLADVAWDFEKGRPMHSLAMRVCTNERIVGNGRDEDGHGVQDLSVCTCEEGKCCGIPKLTQGEGCCASGSSGEQSSPGTDRRPRSSAPRHPGGRDLGGGPLPRYECATGTCAPLASPDNPHAAPRLPSCCGGGDASARASQPMQPSNPRTWHNGVLAGHVRITSTTRLDSPYLSEPLGASAQPSCRDHHVQLELETNGPATTVRGLTPHILTVIATHLASGGGSAGVISSLLRSFTGPTRQQRLLSSCGHGRVFVAVRKQDLGLRVAIKQMGPAWTTLGSASGGDDGVTHIIYVAQVADLLVSPTFHT